MPCATYGASYAHRTSPVAASRTASFPSATSGASSDPDRDRNGRARGFGSTTVSPLPVMTAGFIPTAFDWKNRSSPRGRVDAPGDSCSTRPSLSRIADHSGSETTTKVSSTVSVQTRDRSAESEVDQYAAGSDGTPERTTTPSSSKRQV